VVDNGQYDKRWALIHMNPEEAVKAAEDLQAKALLPAHVGRIKLAQHSWDEPFKRITAASVGKKFRLLTPMIGEAINVGEENQRFSIWWEGKAAHAVLKLLTQPIQCGR
jgi:L-ascorbate metabolism protein UlaG (beta-lactamase superfamily)